MANNYRFKFEIKPNRYCYIQNEVQQSVGRTIKSRLETRWTPPDWCCHLHQGGHIAALDRHTGNRVFAAVDLAYFFGTVGRSKIIRALKRIGFSFAAAKEIAIDSTVRDEGRSFIPYGFVQSPLLATIALVESHLGRILTTLDQSEVVKSLYVDDIILSHPTYYAAVHNAYRMLMEAADKAGFAVNFDKCQSPSARIEAFNIVLQREGLALTDDKLLEFRSRIAGAPVGPSTMATIRYAELVNADQGNLLRMEAGL